MIERIVASVLIGALCGIGYGAAVWMADPKLAWPVGGLVTALVAIISLVMLRKGPVQ